MMDVFPTDPLPTRVRVVVGMDMGYLYGKLSFKGVDLPDAGVVVEERRNSLAQRKNIKHSYFHQKLGTVKFDYSFVLVDFLHVLGGFSTS